jgi:hypothetical protein
MRVGVRFTGENPEVWLGIIEANFSQWRDNLEVLTEKDRKYICDKVEYADFKTACEPAKSLMRDAKQIHPSLFQICVRRDAAEGFKSWWEYVLIVEEEVIRLKHLIENNTGVKVS